ncbi:MAG: YitT family protein [Firmicutes bacterium]|nr:YitT family protein [Bacillota bacterium]
MAKIKMTAKQIRKAVSNVSLVVLGNIVLAIGTGFFLVPANIVAGGESGIAIILNSFWNIPIDITVGILSWFFFVMGAIFLGKKFTLQTLLGTIVYPVALSIIYRLFNDPIGLAPIVGSTGGLNEFHGLLAGIFGGAFVGAGCAITYLGGGSTGGVDVPVFIIRKYFGVKASVSGFVIDAIIIGFGIFAISVIPGMIGIISAFISSMMVELIFIGGSTNYVAQIVSTKSDAINEYLQSDMGRGTTIIDVRGGYKETPYRLVQVAFEKKEYVLIRDAVSRIDPNAFVTFMRAQSINGAGFEAFPEKNFKKSLGINEFFKKKK